MMLMVVFLLLPLHHFSAKLIQTDFRVIFFSLLVPGQLFTRRISFKKTAHILLTSHLKDLNKQMCPHRQFISNVISFI